MAALSLALGSCWRGWWGDIPSLPRHLCCVTVGVASLAAPSVLVSSLPAERQMFLATWKDIPNENETQFQIKDCSLNAGGSHPLGRTWLSSRLAAGDQFIPVVLGCGQLRAPPPVPALDLQEGADALLALGSLQDLVRLE